MTIDILNFIPAAAELRETTKIGGQREYRGKCPFCKSGVWTGDDRWKLWPDRSPRETAFWCRRCGSSGDAIALLRALDSRYDYISACRALGLSDADIAAHRTKQRPSRQFPRPRPAVQSQSAFSSSPSSAAAGDWSWSTAAKSFVSECAAAIMQPEAVKVWAQRYLCIDTLHAADLGWHDVEKNASRKFWGLPGDGELRLPRGLVMPVRRGRGDARRVTGITVGCVKNESTIISGYRDICGGTAEPFILAGRTEKAPVMILESILDALLVWQESDRRISVVATRGAQKALDHDTIAWIKKAPLIYLCPDRDRGGQNGVKTWVTALTATATACDSVRMILAPPPAGVKDPGELQKAALSYCSTAQTVREWLESLEDANCWMSTVKQETF